MAREGNPQATIVADLTDAPHIPDDTFDCAIVTQTLQFVYDVRAAFATLHRILAPGGVLLATVPGHHEDLAARGRGVRRVVALHRALGAPARRGGVRRGERRGRAVRQRPRARPGSSTASPPRTCAPRSSTRATACTRSSSACALSSERCQAAPERRASPARSTLPVDAGSEAAARSTRAALERVEPPLEPDHVRLAEHRGLDGVRRASSTSVGIGNAERRARRVDELARSASRSRVSTTSRPSARPRSSSSSATTSAS